MCRSTEETQRSILMQTTLLVKTMASMSSIFLPESLGHPLPDTLAEAARLGHKPFWKCWSRKKLEQEIASQRKHNLENKEEI